MNDDTFNPNDPLFLASRSLDETLSERDRRTLDEALAASPELRRAADDLRAVSRLVEHWGRTPVELDWEHFAALTSDRASIDDASLEPADRLFRRWGESLPAYDADAFTRNVLGNVPQSSKPLRGSIGRGGLFRIGAPVAAAAAIGFVLTAQTWFGVSTAPMCRVAIGPSVTMPVMSDDPAERPRAIVSFSQSAPSGAGSQRTESARSFGVVFSSRAVEPVAFP